MKLKITSVIVSAAFSVAGQGAFQNLDFESATLSPSAIGVCPNFVSISSGLPGWTGYIAGVEQTEVLQNDYTLGAASIDILGPNYPVAGATQASPAGPPPGTLDGNYSVLLQAGFPSDLGSPVSASIAQDGTIPVGDESLQFRAWQLTTTAFSISFNGDSLSPVVLGSGPNYTVYGVNIAPYAGQTGTLEFTAQPVSGSSWLGLDDIALSAEDVPEPSSLVLTSLGGLLWALYCRCKRHRQ